MIRPSPEILALARRLFQAGVSHDAATLRNLYADGDIVRFVGTDLRENWSGAAFRDGLGAHYAEAPEIVREEEVSAEAFEDGSLGWAFSTRRYHFAGVEAPQTFRFTLIYTLQDGMWRIVHRHASVGTDNRDLHGSDHHAIEDLMQAARAEDAFAGATGMATVMFTDIVGSTTLAAALGDGRWSETIRHHLDEVAAAIEAEGGRVVKTLGDGTMSAFNSAGAAMQAAMALQRQVAGRPGEPRLQIRIGLHTGDVVDAGDDFFGTVVNKAARIAALAGAGEIRVSDATRIMVGQGGDLAFTDPLAAPLKGLDGDHLTYRLEWQE